MRIVIPELSRHGERVSLDAEVAAALAASSLVKVRPAGNGQWRLLPAGRVGAVSVSGIDVQVVPKISISRLLFILGYAHDPGFRPEDTTGEAEPGLWPAIGESLARQTERALRYGIRQDYVTVDGSLALVRGRVRIADQISRRPGMLLPLEVRYDEYSPNVAENQILRSAIRVLRGVPRLHPSLQTRLKHLDARFDGVAVLPPRTPLPSWRTTRLNAAYVPAVRLAEIILRHHSAEPGPGGLTIAAFVVNMAKAFEDFLFTAMQEALHKFPGSTQARYPVKLDKAGRIPMEPDVVHLIDGWPVAVFDAKYKLEKPNSRHPNADLYQMLAYCTALQLKRGWLIYAHGTTATTHSLRHAGINIELCPLDLAQPPHEILKQLDALAAEAIPLSR